MIWFSLMDRIFSVVKDYGLWLTIVRHNLDLLLRDNFGLEG